MSLYIIPGALGVSLITMFLTSLFSKRPLRALWAFVVIVFLVIWAARLWKSPVDPAQWAIQWFPMFLVTAIGWFLIILLIRPSLPQVSETEIEKENTTPGIFVGLFFWLGFAFLIIALATVYYYIYHLPDVNYPGPVGR